MTPEESKKFLDEINKYKAKLGKNPIKVLDTDNIETAKLMVAGLRAELRDMGGDLQYISDSFKDSVNELSNQNRYLIDSRNSLRGISDISRKILDYRKGETSLDEKQLKNLQQQAKTKFDILQRSIKVGNLTEKQKEAIEDSLKNQELFQKSVNDTIDAQKEVNKQIGLVGTGIEGISKGLSKMGFGNLTQPLTEAIEKTKNARLQILLNKDAISANNKELEKLKRPYKFLSDSEKIRKKELLDSNLSLKSQNKELDAQTSKYKNIGKALTDQLTKANLIDFAIQQMLDALTKADTQTGQLAKAFGTSYSEALSLRSELNTIASLSGDINMTTGALQESLVALNKEFGTATMFSGELLTDFTNMTKVMGYTDEAALKLSKITVATGTDLSDNTSQILGTAAAFNATNKLALNEKEIVEGVAKASAATTVSLGMQPGKIASAVVQAKALGLELEQVEGIAESLLNFESSISNELEAELLTGRSLNLEQARYLALTNDVEGVAKEIAKQGITAAEFGGMNVTQQKALAEAVGMTREELAQSLINQQALTKLGGKDKTIAEAYNRLKKEGLSDAQIQKQLGEDISVQQLKSQSIQERFNASVEKLKEIFVTLTEPLLIGLNAAMNVITPIIAGFEKMKGSIKSMINPELAGFLKQVLGGVSSAAAIGSLMVVLAKLTKSFVGFVTRGTKDNPMITKPEGGTSGTGGESGDSESISSSGGGLKPASIGKQLKTLVKNPKAIGRALRRQGGGSIMKGLLKGGAKRIPYLGALLGAGMEFADGGFNMESAGRALLSGGGSFAGGLIGTAIAPGAGTIAGGIGGGIVGDALGDALFGKRKEEVEEAGDFISRPGQPLLKFREDDIIMGGTNLLGNAAQTTSPSISPNMAPLINEMQAVKAVLVQILNKDSNIYMDGAKVGKGIAMASSKIG